MPRPLSLTTIFLPSASIVTFTRGTVVGSQYCSAFETYSHTACRSVLKSAALCSKSLPTCERTSSVLFFIVAIPYALSQNTDQLREFAVFAERLQCPSDFAPSRVVVGNVFIDAKEI